MIININSEYEVNFKEDSSYSVIIFNFIDLELLTILFDKSYIVKIYNFLSQRNVTCFHKEISMASSNIKFNEMTIERDMFLKYKTISQSYYESINSVSIRRYKLKLLNEQLLNNSSMTEYFKENPDEMEKSMRVLNKNSLIHICKV